MPPPATMGNPWVVCRRPRPDARVRLFCFPYAGGGASIFQRWPEYFPEDIELNAIQLPGHETRICDPPHSGLHPLLCELAEVLQPHLSRPFALLGHSMGALISYELTRRIRRDVGVLPTVLFLSGLRALQIPNPDPPLHSLSDPDFIQQMQTRYGMPATLRQESELLELFMPLLRANFQMCETYTYLPEPPLDCPLSVFGGLQDPRISREDLAAWKLQTRRELRLRMIEGGHYFFEHSWMDIAYLVARDLTDFALRESVPSQRRADRNSSS
jgi:medium-chain acyl-[acyl-carrier-protein] hydrolase